jgi:hypothetical protein
MRDTVPVNVRMLVEVSFRSFGGTPPPSTTSVQRTPSLDHPRTAHTNCRGQNGVELYATEEARTVIATLACDEEVSVSLRNQGAHGSFDKVRSRDGKEGYVYDAYVEILLVAPPKSATAPETVPTKETSVSGTVGQEQSPGELPHSELPKLQGRAGIDSSGNLIVDLYNGSPWTISEFTVLLTVRDRKKNTVLLSRQYRVFPGYRDTVNFQSWPNTPLGPLSSSRFSAAVGFTLRRNRDTLSWSILSAKGHKE